MTKKDVDVSQIIEADAARHTSKIEKLLSSYSPDLVQLHATLSRQARRAEYNVVLNLTLPTGTLHCIGSGADIRTGLKDAFSELESQLKKHKEHLRHDYEWKRKRRKDTADRYAEGS